MRVITMRNGSSHSTVFPLVEGLRRRAFTAAQLAILADVAFLKSQKWPDCDPSGDPVRIADLFSGCGAMSLGVWEACRAIGRQLEVALAVDNNEHALNTYAQNFPGARTKRADAASLLNSPLGARPTAGEVALAKEVGRVDLALAGPPCQGHSDLNNYSRRNDPKNGLYDRIARFAELVRPKHIVVENVPAALHDRGDVVERTAQHLRERGYHLDHAVVEVSRLGVAQKRRRHLLVASLEKSLNVLDCLAGYLRRAPSMGSVIADLLDVKPIRALDKPALMSAKNLERIEYLFRFNLYDLPDSCRPDCHRLKKHTYRSVYGRLYWGRPAQTITSGFTCMGQGRFVHPKRKRTLTPHEAARLQFLPDFFQFDETLPRAALCEMIANAVPPKLAYVLALELLR
ncbi:MAG TPA: DNA cytosine methyltransferase [Candidatus Sulfotelmatobacter sp.]|nr:DNA cytosine methyltransferase [Candidatus Sulfotelmatobacter sp.]